MWNENLPFGSKTICRKSAKRREKDRRRNRISDENFVIVEGDITKRKSRNRKELLEKIKAETTDVHHLAAVYDLGVKKDLAFSVNVEGTKNINDFVKKLPNLNRYNYVSTCYVAENESAKFTKTNSNTMPDFVISTRKQNIWRKLKSRIERRNSADDLSSVGRRRRF